jgi:hypothetical protein
MPDVPGRADMLCPSVVVAVGHKRPRANRHSLFATRRFSRTSLHPHGAAFHLEAAQAVEEAHAEQARAQLAGLGDQRNIENGDMRLCLNLSDSRRSDAASGMNIASM